MRYIYSFLFLLLSISAQSQLVNPITWTFEVKDISAVEKELLFTAQIEKGWHLYAMNLPEGGPQSTTITYTTLKGAKLTKGIAVRGTVIKKMDQQFAMELSWYDKPVTFVQKIELTDPTFRVEGVVRFMGCNDKKCLSPVSEEFSLSGKGIARAGVSAETPDAVKTVSVIDTTKHLAEIDEQAVTPEITLAADSLWWTPVVTQLKALGEQAGDRASSSLWLIFLAGFGGGLLALLTPCVWPMIPMTVSFFLKRTKSRKRSVRDAFLYGVAIVVIYVALGLIITAIFGASALNNLATNAVFNIIFFLLLLLFAISFLGAFEITLPSSWSTKLDNKADTTTGFISIFFMAFTLALVSFSCTGPIIGTLLVQAASMSTLLAPAIGMFAFALALAIPFSLFAIFPSWLQSMPKSGGWLNAVKVVLGFLELALALKFLSVADLAYGWHILDREVFVALWIVIFTLLGLYLLGKLKFSHDSDVSHISVPRLFMAIVSLSFAVYMVPGLWGAPLKAISAFTPPLSTQDFNLYKDEVHAQFTDYEEGMRYAQKVKKPVLIDFSGYGCVNCRKMEAAVWTDPKVKEMIDKNYVLITLIVDQKTNLETPIIVEEHGKKRTLRTVGDKWSYLQRHKFGANAQPYYLLLDNNGLPLASAYSFNENVNDYLQFLSNGIVQYKQGK